MTHKPPQGIDAQPLGPCICPPGHIGHWEACPAGYIKPASLRAAPNCAHKEIKKQMVGEFVYYVCECGQKFRIEPWDGKVSVLAPPAPRKDLALDDAIQCAARDLPERWRIEVVVEKSSGWANLYDPKDDCLPDSVTGVSPDFNLEEQVRYLTKWAVAAEMRGAKR